MTDPKGYSRLQIALHWLAALLIVHQYLFKDAISAAWDAAVKGMESAFNPRVLAHLAGGALVLVFALWRLSIRAGRGAPETLGDSAVQRALAKATPWGSMP